MPERMPVLQNIRRPNRVANASLIVMIPLGLVLLFSLSTTRTISVAGKILPSREWVLARNEEGGVLATLADHAQGSVEHYSVFSIIRGDAFQFDLNSPLKPGDHVTSGDTVVRIYSHDLARDLSRLSSDLSVSRATLTMDLSGEKDAVVKEAQRSLTLAKENADLQKGLFNRQDSLYHRDLISREDYEVSRNSAALAVIQVAIAEARLQTVVTGSKPEQIDMIESQIAGLERQIRVLSAQMEALTLVSPLSGILLSSTGTDTLCIIEDTARVVMMPVPIEDLNRLAVGQKVTLRVPRGREPYTGRILRIDRRARLVIGRQVVMATADVGPGPAGLPSNVVVVATVETDRVSLARYIWDWFSELLNEVAVGATGA